MGTPSYMPPEQARGEKAPIGPLADVYAHRRTLYAMLTGRPPFQGASVVDTLAQVTSQEPVAPSQLVPKLPRDLETICLKCLQKDPGKRYATAKELAEDLNRFQAGEPIFARPVGRLEKAAKWVKRNPMVAALLSLSLTLLLGGSAGVLLEIHGCRDSVGRAEYRSGKDPGCTGRS